MKPVAEIAEHMDSFLTERWNKTMVGIEKKSDFTVMQEQLAASISEDDFERVLALVGDITFPVYTAGFMDALDLVANASQLKKSFLKEKRF